MAKNRMTNKAKELISKIFSRIRQLNRTHLFLGILLVASLSFSAYLLYRIQQIEDFNDNLIANNNLSNNEIIPSKYGHYYGYVVQVGGTGSRLTTKNAEQYDPGGNWQGYLKPVGMWVPTTFTNAGDMWVNCAEGFKVTSCDINWQGANGKIDDILGCFVNLNQDNQSLKTEVNITCQK